MVSAGVDILTSRMSRTRKLIVRGHTNAATTELRFEFHLLNVLPHCVTTSGNKTTPPGSFNRARPLLQIKFQLFRDSVTRKKSKRGCLRVRPPGYQLLSHEFRLPKVLPRSGATRLNQPAGPKPFERARTLLQVSS